MFYYPNNCKNPTLPPLKGEGKNILKLLVAVLIVLLLTSCGTPYGQKRSNTPASDVSIGRAKEALDAEMSDQEPLITPQQQRPVQSPQQEMMPPSMQTTPPSASEVVTTPTGKPLRIGVMLPLSGKMATVGNILLDATIMALADIDEKERVTIIPFDNKEDLDSSIKLAKHIKTQNIDAVVGPLFIDNSIAVAKELADQNIPVFSLSNSDLLGKPAPDNLYRTGFMIDDQMKPLITYEVMNGRKNFAALMPVSKSGTNISASIKSFLASNGANLITTQYYNPDTKDFGVVVGNLKSSLEAKLGDNFEDLVLFVDADPSSAMEIGAFLKDKEMLDKGIIIAGPSSWENATILKNPYFNGAFFAAPLPDSYADFEAYFYKVYSYLPVRISTIAYDMVSMLVRLYQTTGIRKDAIIDEKGFVGVDGRFRILPSGKIDRLVSIVRLVNGNYKVVKPPAKEFVVDVDKNAKAFVVGDMVY